VDKRVTEILNRVLEDTPPTREECIYLLGFHESTPEATFTRGVANDIARRKNGNTALVFVQIGLELFPCEEDCKFCSFGIYLAMGDGTRIELTPEYIAKCEASS
jgi:biotin synthase